MHLLPLASCFRRSSFITSSTSPANQIYLLRLFSSRSSNGSRPSKPQVFKNPKNWVIRQWFLDNISNPYPTPAQMDDLIAESEFSKSRINNSLANLRLGRADPHSLRGGRGTYIVTEWFIENRYGPYPDEAEKARIVEASGLSMGEVSKRLKTLRNRVNPPDPKAKHQQHSPLYRASQDSRDPSKRVGRKQWPPRLMTTTSEVDKDVLTTRPSDATSKDHRPYPCTTCGRTFRRYDKWRTHEFEVHGFNTTEWICMPDGPQEVGSTCGFCSELVKDSKHSDRHEALKCSQRDFKDRIYRSKMSFMQHVRRQHLRHATEEEKANYRPPAAWERAVKHINPNGLWCGFCQIELESVNARMDHVRQHFKTGQTMKDWIPRPPSS
ncbi:homeodomain mating type protein alpha2 [Ascochyta lentis]